MNGDDERGLQLVTKTKKNKKNMQQRLGISNAQIIPSIVGAVPFCPKD